MSVTHLLSADRACQTAFSAALPPALTVEPGDAVVFETTDSAYERLFQGVDPDSIEDESYNAVTGPVFVTGAEPGDALRVEVLAIEVRRAWAIWTPDFGALGLHTDSLQVRPLTLAGGRIQISERLSVPLEPMIGCIGLAPARGESSTFVPAYNWGGNMDLRELSVGATLWLPVQVPGALLSLGDVHAAMGVGEPTWVGVESSARVTVRVGIEKAAALKGPRLRVGTETIEVIVLGEDDDYEDAQEVATQRAYDFLTWHWRLDPFEAYTYCCARVGIRFGGPACPIVLAVIPDPF